MQKLKAAERSQWQWKALSQQVGESPGGLGDLRFPLWARPVSSEAWVGGCAGGGGGGVDWLIAGKESADLTHHQ